MNYDAQPNALQVAPEKSQALREQLTLLNCSLDAGLVRTFRATLEVILLFHSRAQGRLLSPDKAPAGTKRLSNLLRSDKWKSTPKSACQTQYTPQKAGYIRQWA